MTRRILLGFGTMLLTASWAIVLFAMPAHADLGLRETPDDTWMTNGNVYAQALSEDGRTLYIGGKFKQLRENPVGTPGKTFAVNNVAAIDVASGTPVSGWRPAVTGDASTTPTVRALEVRGDKVYIGGKFANVGGQARRNLAAVDASTGAVSTSFEATVGDSASVVYALAADAPRLYVGGKFTRVNGTGRGNLAAVDPSSGALDADFRTRTSGLVRDLEFDSSGATIFAAGAFGRDKAVSYEGVYYKRQSVARLYTGTDGQRRAGEVHPWAPKDGVIQTDSSRDGTMTCWTATVTSTRLFLGCGLGPNYAVALPLDSGDPADQSVDRLWQTGFVGNPVSSTISPDKSRMIFGGHFGINPLDQQVCGGKYLRGLVALNPTNGAIDCSWIPSLDQKSRPDYDGAWNLLTAGDQVWVGGGFIGVSDSVDPQPAGNGVTEVPQSNLARFTYDPSFRPINYSVPKIDLNGPETGSAPRPGGLDATYYDNMDFTGAQVPRVDSTVNFDFGGGSPDPAIGPDEFSARWTGQVEAPVSGEYTFITTADDGVRLFVDGRQVIDNWSDRAPTDDSGTVTLEAGRRYDIQMDYYERGGGAVARLQWAYPGQARQVIPSSSLHNFGDADFAASFTAGPTSIVDRNSLTVFDADDTTIRSATVTLQNRPDGTAETLLAATTGTGVTQSYDAQTGTLSLVGPARKAVFEQVLRSVRYNNTSASPSGDDRRVTFIVNDGFVNSGVATSTVRIQSP